MIVFAKYLYTKLNFKKIQKKNYLFISKFCKTTSTFLQNLPGNLKIYKYNQKYYF